MEAWLVHVRTLLEACRETGARDTDVLLRHYLATNDWDRVKADVMPDAAATKRLTDLAQLLVHLSYTRSLRHDADPARGVWTLDEFVLVDRRLRVWYAALPDIRRGWFHDIKPFLLDAEYRLA